LIGRQLDGELVVAASAPQRYGLLSGALIATHPEDDIRSGDSEVTFVGVRLRVGDTIDGPLDDKHALGQSVINVHSRS
jgi:hypothetical protein